MKVHMIFCSNQGHTKEMADTLMEAMKDRGIDMTLYSQIPAGDEFQTADLLLFGSPACGTEEIDNTLIRPTIERIPSLKGKNIFLFGSYGWGSGRYMELWVEEMVAKGAILFADPVICREEPEEDTLEALRSVVAKM